MILNTMNFFGGMLLGVAIMWWWLITRPSKKDAEEFVKYLHNPSERRREVERRAKRRSKW